MEILIISGLSGGGKSRAASFLEDIGYYTVDNLPAEMMMKFAGFCAASSGRYDRVALVYDVRSGEPTDMLIDTLEQLKASGVNCRMLFLEADTPTIINRYKETRRMHPLQAKGLSIEEAVRRERVLMQPVRDHADFVLDTSSLSTAKLRSELLNLFGTPSDRGGLNVSVLSFGFKHGIPIEADLVFDVRFMPNPYYVAELKNKTGLDQEVRDFVFSFQQTHEFMEQLEKMIGFLLPLYSEEQHHRHDVRPGLTGYAQVHGRNTVSWQDKFEMDVKYADHITFLGDLKIIWDSVMAAFVRRDGISSETSVTMEEFMGNGMVAK